MRGNSKAGSPEPIEFKGTTLSVVSVLLRSVDPDVLSGSLERMLGHAPDFFSGDTALIDLVDLAPPSAGVDWHHLLPLLRRYRLNPVAARLDATLADAARAAGLAVIPDNEVPSRQTPIERPEAPKKAAEEPQPAPLPVPAETMVLDRPLRSGQQVYARGCDLVVTAMVSAGAEVIADGSIHIYAPLRGRALAGARGNTRARIFTTCFEAELVSVAGVYQTFEKGIPAGLAKNPAQIHLKESSQGEKLAIEPLKTA